MDRTQRLLVGLLLAQLVLILLVRSPFSGGTGADASRPLLPSLEAFTPARVEIEGKESEKVSLTRQDGGWALEELGGFPADEAKVDELLEKLRGLSVRRPVVSGSRYHAAFKVAEDDNEGRMRIWGDGSDEPEVDLIFGSSPNYRALHVRLGSETPVYEVRDLAVYDVRPDAGAWADMELVDVPEESLLSLAIDNASGSFELVRQEQIWRVASPETMRDSELDQDEVGRLVGSAVSIRLAEPVGPVGDGPSPPQEAAATVTLRWSPAGGAEQTLVYWIGDTVEDQETQRRIGRSGFDYTGTVWESSVQPVLEKALADLIGSDGPGDS